MTLWRMWKFCLNNVRDPVHTIWKVTIPPFSTVSVHANSSVKGHCMWVHMLMEPMPGPQLPTEVVLMVTYVELHPGSSRLPTCPCNLSAHTVEIPSKTVVGQVAPCQPSATGSPPDQDFQRVLWQTPKGMGLGGPRPPRPQRMAQIRAEDGQRIGAEMRTPVCM